MHRSAGGSPRLAGPTALRIGRRRSAGSRRHGTRRHGIQRHEPRRREPRQGASRGASLDAPRAVPRPTIRRRGPHGRGRTRLQRDLLSGARRPSGPDQRTRPRERARSRDVGPESQRTPGPRGSGSPAPRPLSCRGRLRVLPRPPRRPACEAWPGLRRPPREPRRDRIRDARRNECEPGRDGTRWGTRGSRDRRRASRPTARSTHRRRSQEFLPGGDAIHHPRPWAYRSFKPTDHE